MSQPPLLLQWDLRSYLQYREELHPSDEGHLDKEAEELIGVYHFYNGSGFSNDKDTDEVAHLMRQHFNEFGYYLPKGAIDILKDKEGTVHRNMLSKIEKGLLALRDLVGGEQMSAASQQERMQLFGRLFDQSPRDVCNFIFTEWGMLIHFDAIFSLYEPPEHTRSRYMPINKQMCLQRFTRFRFCHMLEMVYMCKWVSKKDDRKTLYRLWRAGVSDEAVAPLREVFGGVENLPLRSHWARRRPTWAPPVTSRVEVPAGEYDVPD
ncbi:hypothetical protein B0A50_07679 [Salinomyces thailandicus]|uniref:Uncharacterized protein n=1 Tax=Salinomyces thailandicus TaxID=706561 RepID=A0A4U0TM51_9PEZI|nr:hypothetical protein B0A50_07679 [Salinomyces thailandica]